MKRFGWVLFLLSILALPLAAETFEQCILNCPPGNNPCAACCFSQLDAAMKKPCDRNCDDAPRECFENARRVCEGARNPTLCFGQMTILCRDADYACRRACEETAEIPGGCPGETAQKRLNGKELEWAKARADAVASLWAARSKAAAEKAIAAMKKMEADADAKKKQK